jgi:methylthioribose-1-phosphate isomerase
VDVNGVPTRTIRADPVAGWVEVIDQTLLPHRFEWVRLHTVDDAANAIRSMQVRGAPLIGVTAGYGLALAASADPSEAGLVAAAELLAGTRPTAVNLRWAIGGLLERLRPLTPARRSEAAWRGAAELAEHDVAVNQAIGRHGLALLRGLTPRRPGPLRLMTHCNAGWLATVDGGTALAPVYAAAAAGLQVRVWVSETRPRNQGLLTAWELSHQEVPHVLIADNAAGVLIATDQVDAVIVGADRVAANGDVANKVGTYLKALACAAHQVPFYVAAPLSTIDSSCATGAGIPIEQRGGDELRLIRGLNAAGAPADIRQVPDAGPVANPAFDVTPAHLVTALITEKGVTF